MTEQAAPSVPPHRTKLVIRRLPPTLPEEIFWTSVSQWVDESCVWRRYVKGKAADGGERARYSRAYCLLPDEQAVIFRTDFNGHVYRSKAGEEYQALVEPAPLQKTPNKLKKIDVRQGTVETDPDYISFINALSGSPEPPPEVTAVAPVPPPTETTPIIDAIREKKALKSLTQFKETYTTFTSSKASEDRAKKLALASVTAATEKRTSGQVDSGSVLVAGKGREVTSVPVPNKKKDASPSGKEDKKKGRNRGKGKGGGGSPARAEGKPMSVTADRLKTPTTPKTIQPTQSEPSVPRPSTGPSKTPGRSTPSDHGGSDSGRGRGKGGQKAGHNDGRARGGAGGGRGRGRSKDRASDAEGAEGLKGSRGTRGTGGEQSRRLHAAVTDILKQNSEAERGGGGGRGRRGRGRGRGGPAGGAVESRIDD
ncbi:hypothetical protein TREMEDRAFT_60453 [Tremella mesenterica DSM 1558]|uniref:uncharacterized protein n=1 Tax=Tremella mesenterica (strain ATCC 24925 / CBS 8224 / DSM 1558 / NBRC 9311 / NRRL Y-6157 / RJB 2259-6 / UBC 559-6) TaxID=578456 RepID=UPI0003F491D6|nr:uncharacterized protein TREMEDRAFT_60453 [Tremella mesenterica DSM 1558]EIW71527.1 hypothetical protein TREMEDRAFT_60453 [Tremella mesenterica DSM 1558]